MRNTTTGRDSKDGTNHTGGLTGVFMVGWFIGVLTCLIVLLWGMSGETTIQSRKIIVPEKRLTTDGKTVDTLFIYKQER
jgi:hypothetical protein